MKFEKILQAFLAFVILFCLFFPAFKSNKTRVDVTPLPTVEVVYSAPAKPKTVLRSADPVASPSPSPAADEIKAEARVYIANTNTKKFHYPDCSSVDDMKEKNKREIEATREEMIAMGYEPCKRCNP